MSRPDPRRRARLTALFLLGLVLFNPPLLAAFDTATPGLFGWPTLLLFLFGSWAVLVLLLALGAGGIERDRGEGRE